MKKRVKSKIKLLISNLFGEDVYGKLYAFCQSRRLQKGRNKYSEAEINLLPSFVRSGDVVIDIGANFGQYTYPLSKLVGSSGKVFAFEPIKYTFEILQNVVRNLRLTNVELRNVALGEAAQELEFIVPIDNSGFLDMGQAHLFSSEEENKGKKEKVKIVTLDDLRVELPILDKTTFVKCDVEGQELMVFKGAKEFIFRSRPIILCEIEERHTKRYGHSPIDVFNFLKNFGYKSFVFASNKLVPTQGIYNSFINYIFIPQDLVSKFISR